MKLKISVIGPGVFCCWYTLPETNCKFAPKNGWLEYDCFLLGWPIFRCELLVSGSVKVVLLKPSQVITQLGATPMNILRMLFWNPHPKKKY